MRSILLAVLLGLTASSAVAQDWGNVAVISATLGNKTGRLCVGDGSRPGDLGCPAYAPSLTTAGDVSITGNVSANKFVGDGSGLTGVAAVNLSETISINDLADASSTVASGNVYLGFGGGVSNTSGRGNVSVGISSLASNTTGNYNVATGYFTLLNNLTGAQNVASGFQSLFYNTTGSGNVAIGHQVLALNVSGSSNVATGYQTMFNNVSGSLNVATGSQALQNNLSGNGNIASGYRALYSNTTGNDNIAVGYRALFTNSTGNSNVAMGRQAMLNGTGSSNTIIGDAAASTLTTGSSNIIIGSGASAATSSTSFGLNIGNAIYGNIGSGSSRANLVGINVSSPTTALEVSGTVSATRFVGDGSGLAGIVANGDRIVSGSANMVAEQTSATVRVSGTLALVNTGNETCGPARYNSVRINPATNKLELCRP